MYAHVKDNKFFPSLIFFFTTNTYDKSIDQYDFC